MEKKIHWKLPFPPEQIKTCVRLVDGEKTKLLFDYYKDEKRGIFCTGGILFNYIQDYRYVSAEYIQIPAEARNVLIEYKDSDWIKELRKRDQACADFWDIKHFSIYIDNYGLYEGIGGSYQIIDEGSDELGELKKL